MAPSVRDIPGNQANEPALARRYSFDRAHLARHGALVEDLSGVSVRKTLQAGCSGHAALIEITLALERPCQMRFDRLLSSELGVSRRQLRALHECGALRLAPATHKPLRMPIADGQRVLIDLSNGFMKPDLAEVLCRRSVE